MVQSQSYQPDALHMSVGQYLEFEETTDTKHEYAKHRIYAMSGGSVRHGIVTVNVSTDLNVQLEDTDYTVSSPDTRIKIDAMTSFRYPDVTVFCGDAEYAESRNDTLSNPIVLVEVLSPSTGLTDRNEKLEEYIQIASLQQYVLISEHEAKVEVFTRHDTGKWLYEIVTGLDSIVELSSINCLLETKRIYRKVTLDVPSHEKGIE